MLCPGQARVILSSGLGPQASINSLNLVISLFRSLIFKPKALCAALLVADFAAEAAALHSTHSIASCFWRTSGGNLAFFFCCFFASTSLRSLWTSQSSKESSETWNHRNLSMTSVMTTAKIYALEVQGTSRP